MAYCLSSCDTLPNAALCVNLSSIFAQLNCWSAAQYDEHDFQMDYNLYVHYVFDGSPTLASYFMMEFLLVFVRLLYELPIDESQQLFSLLADETIGFEFDFSFVLCFSGFYQKRIKNLQPKIAFCRPIISKSTRRIKNLNSITIATLTRCSAKTSSIDEEGKDDAQEFCF